MSRLRRFFASLLLLAAAYLASAQASSYTYLRAGEAANIAAHPHPGFALMGGGTDLDQAFQFLCDRANGGDMLVLRARGDDEYNAYLRGICRLNSVATLIIPDRKAAADPFVADTIKHAAAIFIAGGDQANYINFWMNTPVQTALNEAIKRGVPIGGTSAGLAVLGEYAYSAEGDEPDDPNLDSKTALADPFGPRINLARGFLDIPILKGIITDTHFARRDRMGRLLTFLARLNETSKTDSTSRIHGIGVQERAAVLLEPDGKAHVVGYGPAYFIDTNRASGALQKGKPLTYGPFIVQKVSPGADFYIKSWAGDAISYKLTVESGKIHSSQTANEIY
ncbi:cyanophycinase [Occallatibacter savannae]|uniref:cyanophycinase n=1 Tax=Occallatibacter savannae TaxID=1002691 RepID=UPI000D689609|nr:cyanophycinase [Occallatibacter savannae]